MQLSHRAFLQTLAAATAAALGGPAFGQTEPSLDQLARAKGLRFGSALGMSGGSDRRPRFEDPAYRELIARECSVLVLENESKWQQLRPDPRQPFRFEAADQIFAWAAAQGMALRGHTLLWMDPKWLPSWLTDWDFGSRPAQEAERLLSQHVRSTCQHFGDKIESWDVVNEAIAPDTGELRHNPLTQKMGSLDAIVLAFELAHEYAPKAQLVYNDFMDWAPDHAQHRAGVLRLLTELKRRGVPVQALGVQGHIVATQAGAKLAAQAREWRQFLADVMALDLDILVTEFDVNDSALPAEEARRDHYVAETAGAWLDVTLSAPRLHRLLCWGLADPHSWLQQAFPRGDGLAQRPLPYDELLRPKPLRAAITKALQAMPAR